ncbi:MAG: phosphodiester glycosidase family protein [Bacteroidota bacterium]
MSSILPLAAGCCSFWRWAAEGDPYGVLIPALYNACMLMKASGLRKPFLIASLVLLMAGLVGGYWAYDRGRPAPIPTKKKLREGVIYRRLVRYSPRLMIAHVLVIDTRTRGVRLFVTPADAQEGPPLRARTTSEFMEEFGVQIAINGDGFNPWWSHSPADYYPHSGDPVTPNGYAASGGKIYARGSEEPPEPTLFISRRGELSFNKIPSRVFNAISGDRMLVLHGEAAPGLDAAERDPRSAIGTNANGRWLYLVVVDGRQSLYSEGATFQELADILVGLGAETAMNLDGGGSSTLAVAGPDGQPVVLNSPIDSYIPGRERPVANHLGIFLEP